MFCVLARVTHMVNAFDAVYAALLAALEAAVAFALKLHALRFCQR